jgi:hypothetical protein
MPENVQQEPSRLATDGFVHGALDPALFDSHDGRRFVGSWNNLRQDTYMADGGTYRLRRYSEFHYAAGAPGVTLLPHVPYAQPKAINHLNGGIERTFEPFEADVAASPVLESVFRWCAEAMSEAGAGGAYKVQTFQNRILARHAEKGEPAPEGMHRDGVDFVLTLLVERNSVEGGTSSVYDAASRECRAEVQLAETGEFLFADDVRMLHDVTAVTPASHDADGHRDVLIAMFTRVGDAAVGN